MTVFESAGGGSVARSVPDTRRQQFFPLPQLEDPFCVHSRYCGGGCLPTLLAPITAPLKLTRPSPAFYSPASELGLLLSRYSSDALSPSPPLSPTPLIQCCSYCPLPDPLQPHCPHCLLSLTILLCLQRLSPCGSCDALTSFWGNLLEPDPRTVHTFIYMCFFWETFCDTRYFVGIVFPAAAGNCQAPHMRWDP